LNPEILTQNSRWTRRYDRRCYFRFFERSV